MQAIIDKIEKLPEMFHVAIKVAKMLDDVDVNVSELAEIISVDQSLTTQILKLCNSPFYGFSRKIESVSDAIAKLGFKTLKTLVFVAISHGALNKEFKGYELGKGDLLLNSISCAVYARHLASKVDNVNAETAFTAGLLRDIGKIVIQEYVGTSYKDIMNIVNREKISFSDAEKRALGYNHSDIGAELAKKWNFPQALIDVIKYHHTPSLAVEEKSDNIKLISVVHLADSLVMMLGVGTGNDGMMYKTEQEVFNILKLTKSSESIETLMSEAIELQPEIDSMILFNKG